MTMKTKKKNPATLASLSGIFLNFTIAIFKLLAGFLSHSIAISADGMNNLSDAGTSLISYLGFRISSKPPDRRHPFGHARMEYIVSLIVSFFILLVGTRLMTDSLSLLFGFEERASLSIGVLSTSILLFGLAVKIVLGIIYLYAYKKGGSKVMRASMIDSFTDVIATSSVIASAIVIKHTGFELLDAIVGLAVSVIIFIAGIKILLETKDALLGQAPPKDTEEKIKKISDKYTEILSVHDLLIHSYGPNMMIASFHAEVDGNGSVYRLHDVIDSLEREIKDTLGISATIHMDPIAKDDETVAEYMAKTRAMLDKLGFDFEMHDFRVCLGKIKTKVFFDLVVPYECKITDEEIISELTRFAEKENPEISLILEIDRG